MCREIQTVWSHCSNYVPLMVMSVCLHFHHCPVNMIIIFVSIQMIYPSSLPGIQSPTILTLHPWFSWPLFSSHTFLLTCNVFCVSPHIMHDSVRMSSAVSTKLPVSTICSSRCLFLPFSHSHTHYSFPQSFQTLWPQLSLPSHRRLSHTLSHSLFVSSLSPSQEFNTSGSSNTDTGKAAGNLETKYKMKELGLSFNQKWNTDNTLATEVTVEDQLAQGLKVALDTSFVPNTGWERDVNLICMDKTLRTPALSMT